CVTYSPLRTFSLSPLSSFRHAATTAIYTLSLHDALPICFGRVILKVIKPHIAHCRHLCICQRPFALLIQDAVHLDKLQDFLHRHRFSPPLNVSVFFVKFFGPCHHPVKLAFLALCLRSFIFPPPSVQPGRRHRNILPAVLAPLL